MLMEWGEAPEEELNPAHQQSARRSEAVALTVQSDKLANSYLQTCNSMYQFAVHAAPSKHKEHRSAPDSLGTDNVEGCFTGAEGN
jgi:cytochrome c5